MSKVKDYQVEIIVETLCNNMLSDKEQLRDISSIGKFFQNCILDSKIRLDEHNTLKCLGFSQCRVLSHCPVREFKERASAYQGWKIYILQEASQTAHSFIMSLRRK